MRWSVLPVVVSLALWASGCCVLDGTCTSAGFAPDTAAVPEVPRGTAAVATPGCDAASVRDNDDTVCATCDFVGDAAAALDICGRVDIAICETRENSSGDACQLCVADDGSILYDDCFAGAADRDVAFCEEFDGASDAEVCTACFDQQGNTVSTSCAPRADDCGAEDVDGRVCTVCHRDGAVVSRTCDAVDIDPAVCRRYRNDVGTCVDCLDDDGGLLSHACTPAGANTVTVCEETVTADGLACTVCVDENGTPVARSCDEGVAAARCEQLSFTEQTCVVCLDASDAVVSIDCARNDCAVADNDVCREDADCPAGQVCFDGACVASDNGSGGDETPAEPVAFEPPPACTMSVDDDGAVCRTCPFTDAAGATQEETQCLSTSSLSCSVVADSADSDGFVDPQGQSCVVCADRATGVEVYRDCTANGAVPPPYCVDEAKTADDACAVCRDAVTDAVVYTSCADAPGGETCYGIARTTLNDVDGAPLSIDGDDGPEEAIVTCKTCGVAVDVATDASAFAASCAIDAVCDDPYGSSLADRCAAMSTLLLAPRCQNPWDAYVVGAGDEARLKAMLAFALDVHGLALGGARVVAAAGASCDDGGRVEVAVDDADRAAAEAAFAGLVVAP